MTIRNTAEFLSDPRALKHYHQTLRTILREIAKLAPPEVALPQKIIDRVAVSNFLLGPDATALAITDDSMLTYAKNFKTSVLQYMSQHATQYNLGSSFVAFYKGDFSLGFYIDEYRQLNIKQAMTIFPVTEQMATGVKLLASAEPQPFPTSVSVLLTVRRDVSDIVEELVTRTLGFLDMTADTEPNLTMIKAQPHSLCYTLQVLARLWATATWFGHPPPAAISAAGLTEDSLRFLDFPFPQSGEDLKAEINAVFDKLNRYQQ